MRVIRAEAMGLCFGVRDALDAAAQTPNPQDVTIYGELVHNEKVLVQLESRGFGRTPESRRDELPATGRILITAHGISDRERSRLQAAGKALIDTTCPLVRRVHLAAQTLERKGYHVLVIGRPGHVEVRGIVEDLTRYDVVSSLNDVRTWPHSRLGVVCQTTTPPHQARQIETAIREQNPHADVRFVDTICEPTRERQAAVERLCRQVDAVVVVGGANSNNTRQLVALCERLGRRAYHVQSAEGIDPAWFEGCTTVGLTAGTSTLDETIDAVYNRLRALSERVCA